MKAKKRVVEAILERTTSDLVSALERSVTSWPLPHPPRQDPDFPALPPGSPEQFVKQGMGLFQADRGAFERNLISAR